MTFEEYQKQARTTILEVDDDMAALYYRTLGLTNEAGEFAGKVKKLIRDDGGELSAEAKEALVSELGDVLWYIMALSEYLNVPMEQLAKANVEKVLSRKERNMLRGSGDNR